MIEIELKKLLISGLEEIDSAKKSLVSLILYRDMVNKCIIRITNKMIEFGYSKEEINKLSDKILDEY